MGLKATLQTFAPLLRNVRRMTVPAKELKIIGIFREKAEAAVGDIAKFTTNAAEHPDFVKQSKNVMTSANRPLNATAKLFGSYQEFKTNALERISEYIGLVPEKMYTAVEKSAKSNEFELTNAMKNYYLKLNECKTMEEVAKMYPEFAHLNIDFTKQLKNRIKLSIPENVCKGAMQFETKEKRLEYMMNYFDNSTAHVKKWQNYSDVSKIQREIAEEVADGLYSGASKIDTGWLFSHKEPLRAYMLDNNTRDDVLLSYLRQYYVEGKSLQEITPLVVNNRAITPISLNEKLRFSDKNVALFRAAISTIDNEAALYKAIPEHAEQINSAIMSKAWKSSCLRVDIANETKYGTGWTNVKNILYKRKGVTNYMNSSDSMIDRFLLNRFKANKRDVTEKNPFLEYEKLEGNITKRVKNFVNNRYYTKGTSYSDKAIIESKEFQEFKSQFDIEGMKASIEKVENHYLNIFFKMFWTDERKLRLSDALKEAYGTVQKNIELRDSMLMQALSEAAI